MRTTLRGLCAVALASLCACGGASRPTADPGAERTVERGEKVAFDGSASRGEITSHLWDFGDGSEPATGVMAEHTFMKEGDFSVSLTVRGPGGAHTASAIVHVGGSCLPTAVLEVITNAPMPGAQVQFSAGNSAACAGQSIASYRWEFGDGAILEGADKAIVAHTYAAKGTYPVALEVFDGRGARGRATRTLNVGVIAGKPLVQCSGPTSAQTGKSVSYTAQGQDPGGGTIDSYEWTFPDDATTPTGTSVMHTFATAGMFAVSVIAKSADGRSSDACTISVNVTAPVDYSGNWLLNPMNAAMTGCSKFTVPFPATFVALTQMGTMMGGVPSGNTWPTGSALGGEEDGAMPGTWRIRGPTPEQDKTSAGCSKVTPEHSVRFTFPSATTINGTWTVVHDFPASPLCNCNASGTFTGIRQ